ncbi:PREDICTED: uncharacterized protein C17orf80 homolog [Elephantulus edwardii]|uniref:uncharacterized protein C17orf80 homolog n=1 Tax=Elephantulus edwardii TaxID=28737 RepID=UPI0003F097C7|nr:PREDICTED: uncharacterized protein C17orf80 homolog [Elephantulus edwardii]
MTGPPPRVEVCPYCKKSFKRLKSHLPYCKMLGASTPVDQKVSQFKPATLSHPHQRKGPVKDLIRTEENNPVRERGLKNTKWREDSSEGTVKTFPLRGSEKSSNQKTGGNIKNQSQSSLNIVENSGPKGTFQRQTKTQPSASVVTSERKCARDLPQSGDSRINSSEAEASLLLDLREPSSSSQNRKYSSALPKDVPVPSDNLKLDRSLPRQELPMKPLDMPVDNSPSPMNLGDGAARVSMSWSSSERDPKAIRKSETGEKNPESLILDLQVSPPGQTRVEESKEVVLGLKEKGHHLRVKVHGRTGNAERSLSGREMPSLSEGTERSRAAALVTGKVVQNAGPDLKPSVPGGTAGNPPLSVSQPHRPSLTSLALQILQEEKAGSRHHHQEAGVQMLMDSEKQAALELRSSPHHPASHTGHPRLPHSSWHPTAQAPFTSPVGAADRRVHPSSMGLEWFSELYPGYLGLGVLPGKPQYWGAAVSWPPVLSHSEEGLSEVLLERSLTNRRLLEPLTRLTASSFSLMSLLRTLQKGWTQCSRTVKTGGVSGITMLFTGYFFLCCNWSFKHLRLQRWRK